MRCCEQCFTVSFLTNPGMTLPCCVCPPRRLWTLTSSWVTSLPPASSCPTTTLATSPDGDAHPVGSLHHPLTSSKVFSQCSSIFPLPCLLFLAGGSLSAQLKQAYLPLVDHNNCSRSDWWGSTVKNTMVCGGGGADSGCNVSHLLHEEKVSHTITLSPKHSVMLLFHLSSWSWRYCFNFLSGWLRWPSELPR